MTGLKYYGTDSMEQSFVSHDGLQIFERDLVQEHSRLM